MIKYAKIFLLLSTIALGGKIDIGEKIPDLKIKLMDGSITSFHKLVEDGPLVVDFWSTWCEPCKSIMEFHNQYHQEYFKEGFKVLMINMERKGFLEKVKTYLEQNNFQFYVAVDQNNALNFTKDRLIDSLDFMKLSAPFDFESYISYMDILNNVDYESKDYSVEKNDNQYIKRKLIS